MGPRRVPAGECVSVGSRIEYLPFELALTHLLERLLDRFQVSLRFHRVSSLTPLLVVILRVLRVRLAKIQRWLLRLKRVLCSIRFGGGL